MFRVPLKYSLALDEQDAKTVAFKVIRKALDLPEHSWVSEGQLWHIPGYHGSDDGTPEVIRDLTDADKAAILVIKAILEARL